MASSTVAVVGCLAIDFFMITNRMPDLGESAPASKFHRALGGKGANQAIALHRTSHLKPDSPEAAASLSNSDTLDYHVRMVGAVGDDEFGASIKESLEKNCVDVSGVRVVNDMTSSLYFIIIEEDSRNNRLLFYAGAAKTWEAADFDTIDNLCEGSRPPDLLLVTLEITINAIERMILTAGRAGIEIVLNAAPASHIVHECYPHITHLVINETEASILSGYELDEVNEDNFADITDLFLRRGARNVVITLGEHGAFYANDEEKGLVPAFKVQVVDATGAGDTFTAAYSTEYLRQKNAGEKWDIKKAVTRANMASAITICVLGAQDGIPWRNEIDDFAIKQAEEVVAAQLAETAITTENEGLESHRDTNE